MDIPQSKQNEQESPRFYHLELYDSSEDLTVFLEEPFRRRDLALHEKKEASARKGEAGQSGSQKELARPDKDKDTEVDLATSSESTAAGPRSSSTADLAKNSHPAEHTQSAEEKTIPDKDSQVQHPDNERGSNGRKAAMDKQPFKPNTQEKDKDSYCITCCVPIRAQDDQGSHHDEHEVIPLLSVVEIAKDELQKNICKLEDQIAHLENFSSHLEEIFITVEENFAKQEQNSERHYNDVMQTFEQRYEESMQALGEEKKEKLEALYKQLVNCGENLETCKELMEAIDDLGQGEDKLGALKTAIATIRSPGKAKEEEPKGLAPPKIFPEARPTLSRAWRVQQPWDTPQVRKSCTQANLKASQDRGHYGYGCQTGQRTFLFRGTYFTLNEETAHPLLSVLEDGFTITCQKADSLKSDLSFRENSFTRSIAILGKPIQFQGKHYWEVDVNDNIEYRIGVAFENVSRDSHLGTSHSCWCMRHTITPSRHIYEFLNNGMTPDIRITAPPRTVGLLLDYDDGTLSFFNTDIMQHLYTFHSHFPDFVCPCFAVEEPGRLRIRNSLGMPTYVFK